MNHGLVNKLRSFNFILSVLENQQNDPFCGRCSAYARSVDVVQEGFIAFGETLKAGRKGLPDEFLDLGRDVSDMAGVICRPEEASGQKKAGNCKLPEGVCFPKAVLEVFKKI